MSASTVCLTDTLHDSPLRLNDCNLHIKVNRIINESISFQKVLVEASKR